MQLNIARGIASKITGGIRSVKGFGVFNLNFLTLSDTHGNTGTFTRAGAANVPDWQGVLQSIPVDKQRVNRGRWDGTQWLSDDGAGNPLHPIGTINGESTYLDLTDYATGQTVLAGGRRAYGGRYYSTVLGGTTAGASPLVDTGVTDWVDAGRYQPGYGQLLEAATTNLFALPLAPATQTITLPAIGDYTLSVGDTGDTGTMAIAAGTASITGAATASVGTDVTINCTVVGTVVCTKAGTLTRAQLEAGLVSTTFVNGIRQNELGNLKFPTTSGWAGANAFPHSAGSLLFSGSPQHDLSQHGNTNNDIFELGGVFTFFFHRLGAGLGASDSATGLFLTQSTAYLRNQSVQYGVEWDDGVKSGTGISQFRVGYRVASTGMSWVWSMYKTYDGAFADTGFLQFFANTVGALPWSVRNTIIHNKALTTQEWDNYVIS